MISKLLLALAAFATMAACSTTTPASSVGAVPASSSASLVWNAQSGSGYIQHVVVIIQENRSFENFFAGFPGANAPMYGYAIVQGRRIKVPLYQTTFKTNPNLPHIWQSGIGDWHNGAMDGFHYLPRGQHGAYVYMDRAEIAPYRNMASQYVLSDAMFPTEFGGSFVSHIMAVAGNDDMSKTEAQVNNPNISPQGCDAPPRTRSSLVNVSRQIGRDNGPFPCFSQFKTMAGVLDSAGLSWTYYLHRQFEQALYSPFEAIKYVRDGPDWNADVIAPSSRVLTDIGNGRLAAVTWVSPARENSDVPGMHNDRGPSWVSSIVNAIGESQFWDSTAIVLIWDEWGGFYDNAAPPQLDFRGLGIRIPCIIISPYAKEGPSGPGYVSHTQYETASILKFIEQVFNLPTIGPKSEGYTDTRANSIIDAFNFAQSPRPFTPFTSKYPASYFRDDPPSEAPVDDE